MSIQLLDRFRSSSANDDKNTHLWIIGAGLYVEQLNKLLKHTDYKCEIIDIKQFENSSQNDLKYFLDKHRSDKAMSTNYHLLYSYILNDLGKDKNLNILEIGMGTNNPNLVSTMGIGANPGSSLFAWEEYCQNSNIFGADVDKDILFNKNRIKTSYVDQLNYDTFHALQNNFSNIKYDLIIDDGLHSLGANFNTLLFGLDNVVTNGYVVVEDINEHFASNWYAIDYILKGLTKYKTYFVKSSSALMYVVKKLS